jgi:predicted CoA-binding protein
MVSLDAIHDFLAQKRFAFVGVARQPRHFSHSLFREFRARGYEPVPVHLVSDLIDDVPCFRSLREIDPPVDSVLFMTPSAVTEVLVRECIDAGIKRVWFYRATGRGAGSPAAVKFCEDHGVSVIPGECPLMYFPGTAVIHRLHGGLKKIAGTYPRFGYS